MGLWGGWGGGLHMLSPRHCVIFKSRNEGLKIVYLLCDAARAYIRHQGWPWRVEVSGTGQGWAGRRRGGGGGGGGVYGPSAGVHDGGGGGGGAGCKVTDIVLTPRTLILVAQYFYYYLLWE